ncbi:MAG TPA: lycopene cyclase family protein [Allosphingosinicella sp.]|jgi:lycopene beta-cyclase
MPKGRNHGLLIAGGGLAGSLAALAMARLRPDVPMLLVAEGDMLGGRGTFLVLDAALGEAERNLLAPLASHSWDAFYALLPGRPRKLKLRCHAIEASAIDAALREALRPEQLRLDTKIVAVRDDNILIAGGDVLGGIGVLDARGWAHQTTLELGWRHGVSRTLRFAAPHRLDLPVAADTSLGSAAGCALFTCVPLDPQRLVVEHVRYARAVETNAAEGSASIDAWLAARGWSAAETEAEDNFSTAVPLGGDFAGYWRIGGARVAKLGARGGFFGLGIGSHAADAAATAVALAARRDFTGAALHDAFEDEAAALWRRRDFHRAFARRLVEGGGCEAVEALYRSEAATVGRFFEERLGLLERRRLLAA